MLGLTVFLCREAVLAGVLFVHGCIADRFSFLRWDTARFFALFYVLDLPMLFGRISVFFWHENWVPKTCDSQPWMG